VSVTKLKNKSSLIDPSPCEPKKGDAWIAPIA